MTIIACPAKCGGFVDTAKSNCCERCGRDVARTYQQPQDARDPEPRFAYGDPDRCDLRTGFMGVPSGCTNHDTWGCHKIKGHTTGRGGRHCSTHLDCGVYLGDDHGYCAKEPGHDGGVHEVMLTAGVHNKE